MFLYTRERWIGGIVIGISTFRIHWILHGILIGFIIGIPFALGFLVMILWTIGIFEYLGLVGTEGLPVAKFIAIPMMEDLSGFLTEFFTSIVFKAGVKS